MRTTNADRLLQIACVILLLAPAPGAAQTPGGSIEIGDLDLEALLDPRIASVSLHEEQASAAPASVFVLTRSDLRAHGFQTLSEALRSVPGLFTYSDGFYQYVGVRGVGLLLDYTLRTLVLIDGHPLNNSLGEAENSFGPDLLVPLSMVDRIEVVKGPVGSVYGPAAFLGVVNVVTGKPGTSDGEAAASTRAAQGRTVASTLTASGSTDLGGLSVSVGGEATWTPGYTRTYPELALGTDRPSPAGGRVAGMDFGDAQKAYLRAGWNDFAMQGGCGHWFRGLPSAPYSTIIGDRRNHEDTLNCFGQVALERTVSPGLVLSGRLSQDWFVYRDLLAYEDPQAGGGGDVGPFRDYGRDEWTSLNLQARWQVAPTLLATVGATGEHHRTVLDAWAELIPLLTVDPVNGLGLGPIRHSFSTINGYLLAEWKPAPTFTLHAGLTAYRHEIFGSRLTPRAAAVWHPTAGDTLKAIYTEGFRAPSASEAFFDDSLDYIPNLGLVPETARSGELVWERRIGSVLALSASAFAAEYDHLIRVETVPAPGLGRPPDPANPKDFRQQARNGDRFAVRGVELGGRLRLAERLEAYGGVSVQDPTGDTPPNTSKVTANLAVSTRSPWRPLRLSLRAYLLGPRPKDITALLPGQTTSVGAQVRVDATAALDVPGVNGLMIEASVLNLLDSAVLHPVPNDFAPLTQMSETPITAQVTIRFSR